MPEPEVKEAKKEVEAVAVPEPEVKEEKKEVEAVAVPEPEVKEAKKEVEATAVPEPEVKEEKKEVEVVVPLASLEKPIQKLLDIKTVKGAFICSRDGLLIQNYYKEYADIEELCAMIAAIYNEAEESFRFLKEGSVEKFIIEKNDETICVITAGESLLTVITRKETKPGLVFVYARKVIDEIREILG